MSQEELEISRLKIEIERLKAIIESMSTPELVMADMDGNVELRHKMFAVFAGAFAAQLNDLNAENFVTAGITGSEAGDLIITVRRATGKTPEELWSETKKLLEVANEDLRECRAVIQEYYAESNYEVGYENQERLERQMSKAE